MRHTSGRSIVLIIFKLFALFELSFGGPAPANDAASQANVDSIVCGQDGQNIEITLNIPDHGEWSDSDAAIWELEGPSPDSSCQPSFTAVSGKVKYGPFDAPTCASSLDQVGDNLEYTFTIDAKPSGSGATYKYDHSYTIKCLYDREKDGIQASFLPLHSVSASGSDDGMLLFTFTLHYADDNQQVSANTAIDLKTGLYGKLVVSEAGFPSINLDVHFKSVKADTSNQVGANAVTLITDGCADDALVSDPVCDNNEDDRFDFNAFRFASQVTGNKVYIHVTALVCKEDPGTTSKCESQCALCSVPLRPVPSLRKRRRQTIEESLATEYYISAGPFTLSDPEKEKTDTLVDEDEGSSVPAHYVAVGVVVGVVAVAIVCVAVILVLRKRRYNAALAESRGAHEAAATGV